MFASLFNQDVDRWADAPMSDVGAIPSMADLCEYM
jgi:hypothetical protein